MKRALACLVLIASPLLAAEEAKHTVQVRGTGVVSVAPDRVSFVAGVESHSASAKTAFAENSRIVQAVLQALKSRGVPDSQIRTSSFYLHVAANPDTEKREYAVANTVTVTRDKIDDVAPLIETAVDAGANEVNSVSYSVSDPAALRQTALERAYADARAQAQHLAAAAGKSLGETLDMTTEIFGAPQVSEAITVAPKFALEPGTQEVSAQVLVTFELK